MLRYLHLRVRSEPAKVAPDPGEISVHDLMGDFSLPLSIRAINGLPPDAKRRIYRTLVPPALLTRMGIHPIGWRGHDEGEHVTLLAGPDTGTVNLAFRETAQDPDPFFCIELADNSLNGIDLNLLLLSDPHSARFRTDYDPDGKPTLFGTVRRNLPEEERAMQAGLSPGQIRSSLNASRLVMDELDAFLAFMSHQAISLEPLTYASAWVFERRGFAYMRGHKLMDDIHREFQPGGLLFKALDSSTPFCRPEQWCSVRGRAWAIQDGILSAIDARWDGLRMVKQIGRHASVNTMPDVPY